MENEDWEARWREGRIGFHQTEVNPYLEQHHVVLPAPPSRVLVPLCGKSLDMLWLREQGHHVLGVELSALAVQAFFQENQLTPQRDRHGPFERYRVDGLELLQGDFLELTQALAGPIDAAFDRASVVAMAPGRRAALVARLHALLPPGAPILLVSLDYPEHEMSPPPHSVPEAQVRALFAEGFDVELLSVHDVLAHNPHFRERGLSELHERVYRLLRRSQSRVTG